MRGRRARLRRGLEEPPPPDHTLSEVIDDYLASDAKFLRSAGSVRARAERIRNEIGGKPVRDITGPLITAMLANMKEREALQPQTVAHHRTLTGTLLGHAIKLGWLRGTNPIHDVPNIEVVRSDVTIIEPEDVPAVVAASALRDGRLHGRSQGRTDRAAATSSSARGALTSAARSAG